MKSQIKKIGKHSFIYGFGDALISMVGFLLIPIYTRYLTPVDYGKLELLSITSSILFILFSQGFGTAFFRSYVFIKKELEVSVQDLISTSYFYLILSALFTSILLYTFSEEYSIFLFGRNNSPSIFVKIIAFTVFFRIAMLIPFQLLRARMESIKYITISLILFLSQAFLNIFFVTVLKIGLKGVLLGNAISGFFLVIITFCLIRRQLILRISKRILKELLAFGLPLVIAAMSIWVLQMSDRLLLQKLSTTHELGLYSLGSRFANILLILAITPFRKVWGAISFQIAAKERAKETFGDITTYFFLILCLVGFLVILWTPLVIKFISGEEFWAAYKVILPLVYANICSGMRMIFGFGMYLEKKTKYIAYLVGLGALVNIILNMFLIPKYGMMGAAFASFISYVIINYLSYKTSQRFYYIPFDTLRLLKICFIFLIVTASSTIFQWQNIMIDIFYRILLMVIFIISFFVIKFFNNEETIIVKKVYYRLRENKGFSNKLKYAYKLIRS